MQHLIKVLDNSCIVINTAIGLSQIETLLGIIILSVQIILIIAKAVKKIIEYVKKKDIDSAIKEGEDLVDKLNEIKDKDKDNG